MKYILKFRKLNEDFEEDWEEDEKLGGDALVTIIDKWESEENSDSVLYSELKEMFGFDYDNDRIVSNQPPYGYMNYPINIDTIIEKLKDFKNKGVNYIDIDYNIDHMTYTIDGLKIEKNDRW